MTEIINPFHITCVNKYYHYLHENDYVFYGHRHTDAEINVILKGSMEITCENNVFTAEAPSAVLIPPGAFHQNRVTGNDKAEMIVFHFEMHDNTFANSLAMFSMTDETLKLISLICLDLENSGQKNGTCVRINESAHKLLEVFLEYLQKKQKYISVGSDEYSLIYKNAVNYMLKNIDKNISVSDIAKECGVCSTTLKKIFSRFTQRGCMTFFGELKLDKAKDLLLSGKSCAFVSHALGFSSQCYFSKRFKAAYGILPSKYGKKQM